MVGDLDRSSFSNIEQQSLEFVKYTLDPWVVRWEQSIARALLTPEEKKKMDVSDTTVRLSMGLEDVNDLYEDIVQELGQ